MLVVMVVNLNFGPLFLPSAVWWPLCHSSGIIARIPPGESRVMAQAFGNFAVFFPL